MTLSLPQANKITKPSKLSLASPLKLKEFNTKLSNLTFGKLVVDPTELGGDILKIKSKPGNSTSGPLN